MDSVAPHRRRAPTVRARLIRAGVSGIITGAATGPTSPATAVIPRPPGPAKELLVTISLRWRLLGLILIPAVLLAILLVSLGGLARPGADAAPPPPAVADTGILTSWSLPLDRGPWQTEVG